MTQHDPTHAMSRRDVIAGVAVSLVFAPDIVNAASDELTAELRAAAGGAAITPGRVTLTMPELAENGNAVALTVSVESPMTAADYVKTVQIFAPENPITTVARFHFNPRSRKAKASTVVRLATSQTLLAVATMNDGTAWSGQAYVLVTLAACIDGG
jgi:sulfur-oxidizing protein SoxY